MMKSQRMMEKQMAIHWLELEQRVLDKVNRPSVGTADQARMVRWTNKVVKDIATSTLINEARIIVGFIAGNVVLLEEDWAGTEEVGMPAYGFGLDGAFYIKYGILIDNIKECTREAIDESEGGYTYDYLDYNIIYKERQEEFYHKPYASARPVYYGVYRYWVEVPRTPPTPPRPRLRPYETLAVWFDNMFTNDATTEDRLFRVHYRRWGPAIDLTLIEDSATGESEYTQGYIYLPDQWDDLLVKLVAKEYLFSIGDKRYATLAAEINDMEIDLKLVDAQGGDLDYPWQIQTVDRIPRGRDYSRG
jgi:hypothetical protein